MNSSLEKLVKNLSANDFKYLTQEFCSKNLELLKQKGAYPYNYMGRFKRFNKEKLPNRSVKDETTGHNDEKLDSNINGEDYLTIKKFWNKFNIWRRNINYFKKDVLLLAYVFEKVTDTRLKFYKLDHCHYVSSPWLNWDAILKMTGVKLEKIIDIDMYLFID